MPERPFPPAPSASPTLTPATNPTLTPTTNVGVQPALPDLKLPHGALYVNDKDQITISLSGKEGDITLGSKDVAGGIHCKNKDDVETVLIDGQGGEVTLSSVDHHQAIKMMAWDRSISVYDGKDHRTVGINGLKGDITLGSKDVAGGIHCKNKDDVETVLIDGQGGEVTLYAAGQQAVKMTGWDRSISVYDGKDNRSVTISGLKGSIGLGAADGGAAGQVRVRNANGKETVLIEGSKNSLKCNDNQERTTIELKGQDGDIIVGNKDAAGRIQCKNDEGDVMIDLRAQFASLELGGKSETNDEKSHDGYIACKNKLGDVTVEMLGETGDIHLAGADCAEYVRVQDRASIAPGTVLCADANGDFEVAGAAYDRRVVGVVSGAGDLRPGVCLNVAEASTGVPLALAGRVFCKVDASYGAIRVGDLLVTSPTRGHAMRAEDPTRAFGAVLGKALDSLAEGMGSIVVLVTLG